MQLFFLQILSPKGTFFWPSAKSCLSATMYLSSIVTQIFLYFLLFEVQYATAAKDDSGLMRLRARESTLADSQLPETIFPRDNQVAPEEISSTKDTTATGDESGSKQDRNQEPWLQQDPFELLLTDCTTSGTTDRSDQSSLAPSAKFQRRYFQAQNVCPTPRDTQPDQLKLQQDDQAPEGQRRHTIPHRTRPGDGGKAKPGDFLTPKVNSYPSSLEMFNLLDFGRKGDSQEICTGFMGQSIPMCAPVSIPPRLSPATVLVPSRFCKFVFVFVKFWLRIFFFLPCGVVRVEQTGADVWPDAYGRLALHYSRSNMIFSVFPDFFSFFHLYFFLLKKKVS